MTPVLRVGGAFFALSVANMDSSARWYSEKLGLSIVMPRRRRLVEMSRIYGIFKAGFIVDDFDRAIAQLRARGVDIAMGPFPAHDGQRANVIIRDNAGNYLQLFAK